MGICLIWTQRFRILKQNGHAGFGIESMHGKRDGVITNGITELSEKLDRDDGMDEHFWGPSCYSAW